MERTMHYETVSEAITELRKQGYTEDFNIEENCIICNDAKFKSGQILIADVYRYEGDTDPADEAVVYALEASNGMKGILVTGFGASAAPGTEEILRELHEKYEHKSR